MILFDRKKYELHKKIFLHEAGNIVQNAVKSITPRDSARPPKDTSKSVTGALKRSIKTQNEGKNRVWVGVSETGNQVKYARIHEYGGTIKRGRNGKTWYIVIPARSYLRKTLEDNSVQNEVQKIFQKIV